MARTRRAVSAEANPFFLTRNQRCDAAPFDGVCRAQGKGRNGVALSRGWVPALPKIRAESTEDASVRGTNRMRPRRPKSNGQRVILELGPARVVFDVGGHDDFIAICGRTTGAVGAH